MMDPAGPDLKFIYSIAFGSRSSPTVQVKQYDIQALCGWGEMKSKIIF